MSTIPAARSTHWLLGGAPGDPALREGETVITYGELLDLVLAEQQRLGARQLLPLEARPTLDFVVAYLAALAGSHPVLLLADGAPGRHPHLLEEYRPGTTDGLHPDLALLLSTSGSTGSPKLVRLSRANVLSNARSIADYLDLRPDDVAITALPLHYCYGLSVLHSHLLVGATVVLTDLSVADACFWDLAEQSGVTGVAGVPHTYALLDAIAFGERVLPRLRALRYLTQAGGRLAPAEVRRYAGLLAEHGVDLFVMYGQTEATARMAYLPPELALDHADTIGVAVPGGAFHLAPAPGAPPGTGELVYTGPNVMMGYAHSVRDLARGSELSQLRTGDLARVTDAGLVQVLGRLDRHAKVLGHRVDLDRLEATLTDEGDGLVRLVARPDRLWAFTTGARHGHRLRERVAETTGLRGAAVRVVRLDRLPVTAAGKPDEAALRAHVEREEALSAPEVDGAMTAESVRDLYAVVLGRPEAKLTDSFMALGGDSLSYVEVSTRLGRRLGTLPPQWHTLTPAQLVTTASARGGDVARRDPRVRWAPVEMTVLLRAVAIALVVVTHVDLAQLQGGAHVLLAVAGFNLARFQLSLPDRRARALGLLRTARAVAAPVVVFVGALSAVGHQYHWSTAMLLNGLLGGERWDAQWQFWFLETLVWCYVGLAALVALPLVPRGSRVAPFTAALAVLSLTLVVRYWWTGVHAGATERYTPGVVAWCLALGACAAYAGTRWQRVLVALVAAAAAAGFFGDFRRETIVVLGVLLLLVPRPVRVPARAASAVGVLASASLWIYLTHWQVYPPLEDSGHPVAAVLASVAAGVAAWKAWTFVSAGSRCRLGPRAASEQRR